MIEPESKLGIQAMIGGIADDFQLQILLMARFPHSCQSGPQYNSRINAESLAVATGEGPQKSDEPITGAWNLYSYKAHNKNRSLPDPNDYDADEHWIWGEGKPADIPVYSGFRVILLGPSSYDRLIGSQRSFVNLQADIYEIKTLSETNVDSWLEKMSKVT